MTAAETLAWLRERHTLREQQAARETISEFLVEQAERTAAEVGFGYLPTSEAPSTFAALKRAYARSVRTGEPLPVSNLHCESVAFTEPAINYALRFWHDSSHVQRNLNFGTVDEYALALWHLDRLALAGFGPATTVYDLLRADVLGAVLTMGLGSRFPDDQHQFAVSCLTHGFDRTVLAELQRGTSS